MALLHCDFFSDVLGLSTLYAQNRTFAEACAARGAALHTDFGPGAHERGYWDPRIQDVLGLLPLGDEPR